MWIDVLDRGLQWYERLQVLARGDLFERLAPQPEKTSNVESIAAVLMVLSVVAAAAGILAKILL